MNTRALELERFLAVVILDRVGRNFEESPRAVETVDLKTGPTLAPHTAREVNA